jgi:kynureninase
MPPRASSSLDLAATLDAEDPLRGMRRAFELPRTASRPLVYLCGHSLGALPRTARTAVAAELERWSKHAVEGHFRGAGAWFSYHEKFAAPLAELVGAHAEEVVAMNSLTTNLHLLLVSFFRPAGRRSKILIERGAFPSDRYAVQSQLAFHGLNPDTHLLEIGSADAGQTLDPAELGTVLTERGDEIALILLPGVQFLTGQALPIRDCVELARRSGCRIGFDLAHAIGNVPLALHRSGADFAVWCSYKYLNAGPGAVAGCFVHRRWLGDRSLPRFSGWWGHDKSTRFAVQETFAPAPGADAWQLSNPPILAMAPLAASLAIFERATFAAVRDKSVRLTAFLETSLEREVGERIRILTPRSAAERGCQLSIRLACDSAEVPDIQRRVRAAGVVVDWRGDVLRIAPAPLYNRYRDVAIAVRALRKALQM